PYTTLFRSLGQVVGGCVGVVEQSTGVVDGGAQGLGDQVFGFIAQVQVVALWGEGGHLPQLRGVLAGLDRTGIPQSLQPSESSSLSAAGVLVCGGGLGGGLFAGSVVGRAGAE